VENVLEVNEKNGLFLIWQIDKTERWDKKLYCDINTIKTVNGGLWKQNDVITGYDPI
jgi:hypothetical protein